MKRLFAFVFIIISLSAFEPRETLAQTAVTGGLLSEEEAQDGLSQLIEDAKRDGSTVIVVRPGQEEKEEPAMA
ncbi:MAG: hypothetical protein AAGF29_08270, partial [Pseudomonadota bacterium]